MTMETQILAVQEIQAIQAAQPIQVPRTTEKEDARSLSALEQYERRRQVVLAHQCGTKKVHIARDLGLSYTAVCMIIARYQAEGADAILPHRRGRRAGEGRSLSQEQEAQIQDLIREKTPQELNLDFPEWSRPAVAQLINEQIGVRIHIRSVTNYLRRWNIVVERAEPRTLAVRRIPQKILTVPTLPSVPMSAVPMSTVPMAREVALEYR